MNFFKKLDSGFEKVLNIILTLCIGLIVLIVCVQVVSRNIFYFDLGLITNVPVYLMICGTWLGAVAVARKKEHITVPLLAQLIKNDKINSIINLVLDVIITAASAIFAYNGYYQCLVKLMKRGTMDPTLNLPEWVLRLIIPIAMTLFTIYYIKHVIVDIKEVRGK